MEAYSQVHIIKNLVPHAQFVYRSHADKYTNNTTYTIRSVPAAAVHSYTIQFIYNTIRAFYILYMYISIYESICLMSKSAIARMVSVNISPVTHAAHYNSWLICWALCWCCCCLCWLFSLCVFLSFSLFLSFFYFHP